MFGVVFDAEVRGKGWLRFLERKLALPNDDWSRSGRPAAAWDNLSGAPTTNWYRFDAIGVATTLVLAARGGSIDRARALAALDGLVARLCRYHGFNEWVEQRGPDPQRDAYPDGWKGTLIPAPQWGSYDSPGWAGNGAQADGFQANPIEADGAIYYKGFLNYVLGLRTLVDHAPRNDEVLEIEHDDRWRFRYSHGDINSILERDFTRSLRGESGGLCCEIHKLWPL